MAVVRRVERKVLRKSFATGAKILFKHITTENKTGNNNEYQSRYENEMGYDQLYQPAKLGICTGTKLTKAE